MRVLPQKQAKWENSRADHKIVMLNAKGSLSRQLEVITVIMDGLKGQDMMGRRSERVTMGSRWY